MFLNKMLGLILNLENLENRAFSLKVREKPGNVYSITFTQVKEKPGQTNYIVHVLFQLTLCMVLSKVAVPSVVSKCELYLFA